LKREAPFGASLLSKLGKIMKLNELVEHYGERKLEFDGFKLEQYDESDGDVVKIFHSIFSPDKKEHSLDHSPYEWITLPMLKLYVKYYKEHGKFPNRDDVKAKGLLYGDDLIAAIK
jgi:hypothetical protein